MAKNQGIPPAKRFAMYVQYSDDLFSCWLWTGYRMNKNYGRITVKGEKILAHRFSWMLTYGQIPDGLDVLHLCDVPLCVRPDHLRLGTHAENMADMVTKNRFWHKLTPEQVTIIRASWETQRVLARSYGVTSSVICDIQRRVSWKHLP